MRQDDEEVSGGTIRLRIAAGQRAMQVATRADIGILDDPYVVIFADPAPTIPIGRAHVRPR